VTKKIYILVLFFFSMAAFVFPQNITVTEPDPGETWYKGANHIITWNSNGCSDNNIKINIFRNSIAQPNFVEQLTSINTGSKNWFIPESYQNGNYIIRIKTADNICIGDSGVFSIQSKTTPILFKPREVNTVAIPVKNTLYIPDLFIKELSVNQKVGYQTEYVCDFNIENRGNKESNPCKVRLTIKNSLNQKTPFTIDIPKIPPGKSDTRSVAFNPINNVSGQYENTLIIDPEQKSGEPALVRKNNIKAVKYYVSLKPDLVGCVTHTDHKMLHIVIKNIGEAVMPESYILLMDKKNNNKYELPVSKLNPGETYNTFYDLNDLYKDHCYERLDIWNRGVPKYYILMVDSRNSAKEWDEINNFVEFSLKCNEYSAKVIKKCTDYFSVTDL